jgi:ribonuclease HI
MLFIYTDGSGIEGQIGAAAYSPQLSQTKHLYLGTDKQFNVYTAELNAIELAAEIACSAPQTFTKCRIYSDSQAAIKATIKPKNQSRQAILCNAISMLEKLTA